ncbi:MAG TPA: hypothetical protein VFH61_16825 [Thermoleophilia bacterium]|nr:hypothetical protein [Thermoleophilia bacterium]
MQEAFVRMTTVRSFVRDVLGCTCPDDVFEDVRIGLPALFDTHSVEGGLEILVGRRLLIAIVPLAGIGNVVDDVQAILAGGRRVRDSREFNRYRLVLVGSLDSATRGRLETLSGMFDERVHLHLVDDALFTELREAEAE